MFNFIVASTVFMFLAVAGPAFASAESQSELSANQSVDNAGEQDVLLIAAKKPKASSDKSAVKTDDQDNKPDGDKPEKSVRPDKSDKPEKPDKDDKPDGADKSDKPKKPDASGKSKKSSKTEKEKADKSESAKPESSSSTPKANVEPGKIDDAQKDALTANSKPSFSGNASWYGIPFHGRKTASGEIFNMYKLSAAHLTLPLPSKALVEDPRTGNAVIVKVNDRGPYCKTRVMDLSREAARELGTLSHGVSYVDITIIDGKKKSKTQ